MVQLSYPYTTTGKTVTLTRETFVGKLISLPFNTLSRFVITLLSGRKCLNFRAAVTIQSDFGAQENKVGYIFMIEGKWPSDQRLPSSSFFE